ncbi:hypothetical protein X943_000446 [Babesia divergens]|uniref:Uncharacterized protein n=1 Tax=Babesia divergens TaxID=32595 RepID=A0AAD9GF06_BABDI|nr:hypothetical protein X943_000446 [Babesia divergens]
MLCLAFALCFLYKFCEKVSAEGSLEGKLKDHSEGLKDVCQDLKFHLDPFVQGSSNLSAVCKSNSHLYSQLWDPKHFDDYVKWLKENLKNIIGALQDMAQDCENWGISKVQDASTPGPFPYGFVFKSWSDFSFKDGLSTSALEASLNEFKRPLNLLPPPGQPVGSLVPAQPMPLTPSVSRILFQG